MATYIGLEAGTLAGGNQSLYLLLDVHVDVLHMLYQHGSLPLVYNMHVYTMNMNGD